MSQTPGVLIHSSYKNEALVEIRDHGDYRSLYLGSHYLQSQMSHSRPHELVLSYTRFMVLSLLIQPRPQKILIVGVGAGSFIRFFHHHFPQCHIDAVDSSARILNLSRGYFQLPENDQVRIHCADGYHFVQNTSETSYDLILVDAFDDVGMAPSIYSAGFFSECLHRLAERGVVSLNLWSSDQQKLKEIEGSLAGSFVGTLYLPVPDRGNIVALAMPFAVPWQNICLKPKHITAWSRRFSINFKKMIQIAKENNLSLARRLANLLPGSPRT